MYRFNRPDNERARHFFETAVRLDPTFARAYAGLSFTHFQNAFQGWAQREPEIDRAFEAAGQSLMVDDRDPAAHWAMGRALWLRGHHDPSVVELEQSIDLSPNFALGHYTLAFVQSQAGRSGGRHLVLRPLAPPEPLRPAALRHARRARDGARASRAGSRKPPSGPSRPPPAPTRIRTSSRLRPTAWRWPARSTRRAPMQQRCTGRCRDTASPTSSVPFDSMRTAPHCSARAPSSSAWRDRAG